LQSLLVVIKVPKNEKPHENVPSLGNLLFLTSFTYFILSICPVKEEHNAAFIFLLSYNFAINNNPRLNFQVPYLTLF